MSKEEYEIVQYKPSTELATMGEKLKEVIGYNPIQEIFDLGNRNNAIVKLYSHPSVAKMLEGLENTPVGFLTDLKNGAKYNAETRAQAIIGCVAQGARVVNNEINIIKGKGMLVKNFYHRMITELGHINSPSENCIYEMVHWYPDDQFLGIKDRVAIFKIIVSGDWKNKSTGKIEPFTWEKEITVKFSGGDHDTIDKARGQAERRGWKRFYEEKGGKITNDVDLPVESSEEKKPEVGKAKLSDMMEVKNQNNKADVIEDGEISETKANPEVKKEPKVDSASKAEPISEPKAAPVNKPVPETKSAAVDKAPPSAGGRKAPPKINGDFF